MERSGVNTALVALAAASVGFVISLLIFGNDNGNNAAVVTTAPPAAATTTTTTTSATQSTTTQAQAPTAQAPTTQPPTTSSCIALWNQPSNRGAQTFMINIASQQPIRVNVGTTSEVPPECQITVLANNGDAYVFPGAGGTTNPYTQAADRTTSASLPASQRTANALEQRDGTLEAN